MHPLMSLNTPTHHKSHLLLGVHDVAFCQLLQLDVGVVGLRLHLFLQLEPVLVHLGLQLVLQGDQLLLVLPPHALIPRHLLPQLKVLLMLLDLPDDLDRRSQEAGSKRNRAGREKQLTWWQENDSWEVKGSGLKTHQVYIHGEPKNLTRVDK